MSDTLFIGSNLIILEETNSTNTFALDLLQKSTQILPEGTVIVAQHQTDGRGMRGNKWYSSFREGLAMSVILYPTFLPLKHQFFLSQCIALSVCQLINDILAQKVPCFIKWPNDIYVGSLKLGGILIENNVQNGILAASVVGIGLNLNQNGFPDFLPNPTSLHLLTGLHYDKVNIAKKLCHYLEKWYLLLKTDKLSVIKTAYLQNLYQYRQYARYRCGDTEIIGCISDVSENGFLEIEVFPDNEKRLFDIKEISFVI